MGIGIYQDAYMRSKVEVAKFKLRWRLLVMTCISQVKRWWLASERLEVGSFKCGKLEGGAHMPINSQCLHLHQHTTRRASSV
jgi:hypothetical protein